MAMSGLMDSWVWIYTWGEQTTNLGDVVRPLTRSERTFRGTLQNLRELAAGDVGPGRQATGKYTLFIEATSGIRIGNIVRIASGPMKDSLWEVEDPPFRPSRGRHFECRVVPYIAQSNDQFRDQQVEQNEPL